ncbi:hypothetical protein [Burkholderia sp. PU8-34]
MQQMFHDVPMPHSPDAFEQLCANVYSARFDDLLPSVNGRSGQSQYGLDVLITRPDATRIGIQCKRFMLTKLTVDILDEDIKKADRGEWGISALIFATTALRDTNLIRWAVQVSKQRLSEGKFAIHIEFWQDICNHVFAYPALQHQYVPQAPGGILYEVRDAQSASDDRAMRIEKLIASLLEKQSEKVSPHTTVDEHGRKLINAWRQYVVRRPIGNARKARVYFIAISATGLLFWVGLQFEMFSSHFSLTGSWFLLCMLPTMLAMMFALICTHLLRRLPIMATPVHRSLLLESGNSGDVYITRIFARCPQCDEVMRYTFLGPLKGPMYPRLVCPRNGRAHNLEFDYTTMPDAGTDVPTDSI